MAVKKCHIHSARFPDVLLALSVRKISTISMDGFTISYKVNNCNDDVKN